MKLSFTALLFAGLFFSCIKTKLPFSPDTALGSAYPNICQTDDGFIMIWYEGDEHIVMSEFDGKSWSKKDTIVSSKSFFKNWADLPQIYHTSGETLAVSWLEMIGEGTYDYGIKIALSSDRGRTWSSPISPHRDAGKGEHGFVSFFTKPTGELGLIWLDGRHMGEYDIKTHTMGDMALYTSEFSTDFILSRDEHIDKRVCECCPTDAVEIPGGVLIAYRDRSEEEIRNINMMRYTNKGWSDPIPVFEDNWFIPGCPVNGPALATEGKKVAISWYTAPDNGPQVNVAFSLDGGISFTSPFRIDDGRAIGRTDLLWLDEETVLVSWLEEGDESGKLALKKVGVSGSVEVVKEFDISAGRGSGYPKLATADGHVFVAWTEPGDEGGGIQSVWIKIEG